MSSIENNNFMTNFSSSKNSFLKWVKIFSDEEHIPISIVNGVPIVLQYDFTEEMHDAIYEVVPKKQCGFFNEMACDTCRDRLKNIIRLKDFNGRSYFMNNSKDTYPNDFHGLWDASRTGKFNKVLVVKPDMFGIYTTGHYEHFSIGTSTNIPNLKNLDIYQRLFDKYIPIMGNLFEQNGVPGIYDSMDAFIKILPTVTYGVKLLESAKWFRKHICENFKYLPMNSKLVILCKAITSLKYCQEIDSGDLTLPLYHQLSKNTLDALAVCDDINQLRNMLNERLSPLNYQVKIAKATDKQIDIALKYIGEFGMSLMTLKTALDEHKAIPVIHKNMTTSSSAFEDMRKKKSYHNGAAGFSHRSNSSVRTIKTMSELMTGSIPSNLEVNVTGQTPVYSVSFTGQNLYENGVYQTPFSWGFQNNSNPGNYGLYGWCKVFAILPMKNNYMFICEGARPCDEMDTCCHVELLTAGYNKSCGKAFGNLKNHLKLQIEDSGPYAIGVGVSLNHQTLEDTNPPINGSITLRSNGTVFTIN